MNMTFRARCYHCQAPLKISFTTYGSSQDALYTWILKEPIDLGFNTVNYSKVGSQIKRVCYDCNKSLSDSEIFDWVSRGQEYTKTAEKDKVPILFRWTYWLIVPGLYAWYHRSTPQRNLISYADLDT